MRHTRPDWHVPWSRFEVPDVQASPSLPGAALGTLVVGAVCAAQAPMATPKATIMTAGMRPVMHTTYHRFGLPCKSLPDRAVAQRRRGCTDGQARVDLRAPTMIFGSF